MNIDYNEQLLNIIKQSHTDSTDKVAVWTDCDSMSYAELEETSDRIAKYIGRELYNQGCNDTNSTIRIGVNMHRTNLVLASVYAIAKLGCTYVPIATDVPIERKQIIIEDADMKVVLTDEVVNKAIADDSLPETYPHYSQPEAYIIFTSGTTGKPKGISISYQSLLHFISNIGAPERLDINKDSVVLFFTSINFDVSIIELFGTLYYGATMVVATEDDRRNMQSIVSLINNRNVTYASLPTSLLSIMETLDFASLRVLVSIGEPIQSSVAERISDKPYRYVNGYGPTECTVLATLNDVKDPETCNNIGHELPGVYAYVLDKDNKKVKPGEEGELMLGGIQVMLGYNNRPEQNVKSLFENPFAEDRDKAPVLYRTGDIVRLEADGSFYFIGRRDKQIKLHGHRIELGEVMYHISSCEGVNAAYVQLETVASEKHIVAYVVLDKNTTSLDKIKNLVTYKMPLYMIPSFWNELPALPLNINGKIDESKLKNRAIEGMVNNSTELSDIEETIMMVLANIVGLPSINVEADLVSEIGVSSLQFMRAQHDVKIAGVNLSVGDFYKYRTIRNISNNYHAATNYWYNDDDNTTKPVIIMVSGFTDFGYMYHKFAERLSEHFSIYVLESYHTIIGKRTNVSADEMNSMYQELVKDVVAKHRIAAFMGICLGGEHALYLAHTLYAEKEHKPTVVLLDSEIDRDWDETKNAQIYFPYFTDAVNKQRTQNDTELMRTMPKFHYTGPMGIFLCSKFIDYWSMLDPDMTEKKDFWMKKFFETNPERWKANYPEVEITMLPTHHCDFWLTEPSISMICNYIETIK